MSDDAIGKVLSAAELDKRWKPTLTRTTICFDSDLVLEIERLEEEMQRAAFEDKILNRVPEALDIAYRIIELRKQAKAEEVEFVFKGIGRRPYTDMLRAHPPTDEQQRIAADNDQRMQWNPDTFPPALLAAACVNPTGTDIAWWARKYDEWGTGQISRLWNTCLIAQGGVIEVPKAEEAYAMIHGSPRKSA